MSSKVLILVPGKEARGGITNYYSSLKKYLVPDVIYCERGSRNWPQKAHPIKAFFRLLLDYINFIYLLIFKKIGLVQTTTAFYKNAVLRDSIFILIAFLFKKKVIVFFRGWDDSFVYNLNGIYQIIIKKIFFRADGIIDLSKKNLEYLKKLGYKNEVFLETTVVDNKLVHDLNIKKEINTRIKSKTKDILFLSRIEKNKGVFDILNIYEILKKRNNSYRLVFAGDGSQLFHLKSEIVKKGIPDVQITGFVQGKQKKEIYKNAWLFIFLSKFEGMPNAVLEAMAFGLPVITTNVGGINDIFSKESNGLLLNNLDSEAIIGFVENLYTDDTQYTCISENNYRKAKKLFLADIVSDRLKLIFNRILQN